MNLLSKKMTSLAMMFITIILLSVSIYFAFLKYLSYDNLEKTFHKREIFNNGNSLLKSLEIERLKSSLYLIKPNQSNLNQLNEQRKVVNYQIKQNKELKLTKEINALLALRKDINALSLGYNLLIFEYFQNSIIQSIYTKMEKLNVYTIESIEFQLIKLRTNINMENSFLAFILKNKSRMQNNDMLFWERILNLREIPAFNLIKNETIRASINNIHNINSFSSVGEKERVEIYIASKNADYPITFQQWFKKTYQQKQTIDYIQKIISNVSTRTLKNQLLAQQGEMYRAIIISLLILILLGLFIFLLRILKKIDREHRILKNTVKEIEVDLDENKKRKIKEILTHNSSSEVYNFLVNEIKEPSRAKDLFLANMSHEIRTPLNGIIGFTKELKETKLSEEQTDIVAIIEESSSNLIHIVNDILDFSKMKAGKIKLEHIVFDPIEKFEAAIDTYVARAREKEIELKVCLDPKIPTKLLGDPTKLAQILTNLISNAVKFTPNKGLIEINIEQINAKNSELLFSVKDSGIGISDKEKKEIFNAFSQADASTNRKYGGTGLGLSISSQFIKYMGGKLDLESEVGKGTRFFFSIKLDKPKDLEERSKNNLSTCTVGYIPPIGNSRVDKNLQTYVEYQDARFLTYTQRTLLNLEEENLPDLLFIDYKCFENKEDLEYFLDLPLKIVLIVADNKEKELITIKDKIDKILYKPVNFTRTLKSLEVLIDKGKTPAIAEVKTDTKFNNITALVAEDNLINQKLIKSILERLAIEVTVVPNGEEALAYRKKNQYDIIFMDIQMPVMGGLAATKEILLFEKNSNTKHVPIIALTANALEGDKEKYMKAGMDDYLAKPMNLDALKKVLTAFTR